MWHGGERSDLLREEPGRSGPGLSHAAGDRMSLLLPPDIWRPRLLARDRENGARRVRSPGGLARTRPSLLLVSADPVGPPRRSARPWVHRLPRARSGLV